jgi:hypothetical protein
VLPTLKITSWYRIPVKTTEGENKVTIKDNPINSNLLNEDDSSLWIPINPCIRCSKEQEHYYDLENNCRCDDLWGYNHEVTGQTRVLEYLFNRFEDGGWILATAITQMLKQLEVNNGK